MKVVVGAMERSLPTSVNYRAERITSFTLEDPKRGPDGLPDPEALAAIRAAQLADLDAQEAVLRARYVMPEPEAHQPVAEATRAELRRLALRLRELGSPAEAAVPKTEAQAAHLLRQMRANIYDLESAKRAPASTAPTFPPGASVPAGQRVCADASHGRDPRHISSSEWDHSMRWYGKPLCRQHQASGVPLGGR